MKLEMLFVAVIAFSLIFALGGSLIGEGLSEYDVDLDTSSTFGKVGNDLKTIYDYQDSMQENLRGGEVTDESAVDDMVTGGYTAIRNQPFNTLSTASNATMQIAKETGYFPNAAIGFLLAVLSVLIVFAIIALIFRFEQR